MAAQRRRTAAPGERLILDAGAVIAVSRGDEQARAVVRAALKGDATVSVPVVVLAETLRGGATDAPIHRLIAACGQPEPLSGDLGREAGRILGRTQRSDTVDALVMAEAASRGGGRVLTGDPDDMRALAEGLPVVVHSLRR